MKKKLFICIKEHMDPLWRRCFDRDILYKGQLFVPYSDLEAFYIEDNLKFCKKYPFYIECICYSLIAGMFTLFFGGSVIEMFVSLFAGLIVRFVITLCKKTVPNYIFSKFFSSVSVR